MRKLLSAPLAAVILTAAAGSANAVTNVTTTFPVTATVLSTCSVTAPALAFGNYTPGGGALAGTTAIAVKCTNTTPFTVALNGGTTSGGTIIQRLMANGGNTLQYNLYTNTTHTTLWGDGSTGGSVTQAGTGAGLATAVSLTVYGSLPDSAANQASVPGAYTDTITVTVSY
jgi:spore coat protein U-like protein